MQFFLRYYNSVLLVCFISIVSSNAYGIDRGRIFKLSILHGINSVQLDYLMNREDSIPPTLKKKDSIIYSNFDGQNVSPSTAASYPHNNLQQILNGRVSGVNIDEFSGEPGTEIGMLIRGSAIPLTLHQNFYEAQPTVVLDGIPLIYDDPFAFNIQTFDVNRIGPAMNLLAAINPNNLSSIRVVKGSEAAHYGSHAANGGVIELTTKDPIIGGRLISVNSYIGFVQSPNKLFTTNGEYEDAFRRPFYDRYAGVDESLNYPIFLGDSTNENYYGPSNWNDLYFKNRIIRGVDASLSSGTERANFRFALGNQRSANSGDGTDLDRYNAMFQINMVPLEWFTISSMITATRLERNRNNFLRDRFSGMQYIPDLESPLAPNKNAYSKFLYDNGKSIDDNLVNVISGFVRLKFDISKSLNYETDLSFNYNEGIRDVFYPSSLTSDINYVSNYFGFNQRILFNNSLNWTNTIDEVHHIKAEVGQLFEADNSRYNYSYAFDGPNDFVKINELSQSLSSDSYLPQLTSMYQDKMSNGRLSFFGSVAYNYYDRFHLSLLLRADGSSNAQPDNWWFLGPSISLGWNLINSFQDNLGFFNSLNVDIGWSRIGRNLFDDRFSEGPQYVSQLSIANNPPLTSFNSMPSLSRPYTDGFIGYGVKWPYVDELDIKVNAGILDDKVRLALTGYKRMDKDMLIGVPGGGEYGYKLEYKSGMKVINQGIDIDLMGNPFSNKDAFRWYPRISFNFNKNELRALPGGLNELIVGEGVNERKLKVGYSIDQFWLLQNNGIYNNEDEIAVNPENGRKINYRGVDLEPGDPQWKDINSDFSINDDDRVLMGHFLPQFSGGFGNEIGYKNWSIDILFVYSFGRKIMNQEAQRHLDFINRRNNVSINSITEITDWQKRSNYDKYPLYNPWSVVEPFQLNQDLFLEDGSFLKLKNISLQYDFTNAKWWSRNSFFERLVVYVTASNLFTLTPYGGTDPELVSYNGLDSGYGLPLTPTLTVGVKLNF